MWEKCFSSRLLILAIALLLLYSYADAQVTFDNVQLEIGQEFEDSPNCAAWGDIDNDGDLDVLMSIGSAVGNDLMINDLSGSGIFLKADSLLGHGTRDFRPRAVLLADVENDGDLDMLFVGEGVQIWLIINKLAETGSLGFEDVSEATDIAHAGESYYAASMADYDNNGLLDIFVAGLSRDVWNPSLLYKNTSSVGGPLSFEELAEQAGIFSIFGMHMMAGSWGDYDDDGDQDLFIATADVTPVFLYRNEGDGAFTDVTVDAGLAESVGSSRSAVWGDYDNDGDLDVFVGRRTSSAGFNLDWCQLFRNDGGVFTEIESARITGKVIYGVASADYDNDGDLDIHLLDSQTTDIMLRNDGNNTFTDVTEEVLLVKDTLSTGFAIDINDRGGQTWADWDADGDMDLLLPANGRKPFLMQNNGGNANNWLEVKLTGVQSNRSAVGARVTALSGDLRQIREVCMGSGYLAGPPTDVHFGLGQRTIVDSLIIRWPSGNVDAWTNVAVNEILSIDEGDAPVTAVARKADAVPEKFALLQNYPNPFNPSTIISYVLTKSGHVELSIYNIVGEKLRTIVDGRQHAGEYTVQFEASNLPAGVYFYTITAGAFEQSRKMILLK